jgi:hypothetical protein
MRRQAVETQEQSEERRQKFARAALPQLRTVADELESLTTDIFDKRIAYTKDDGASVMVLSFVTKQVEHLRSVRTLIASNSHRDALLIARTMAEGLARLLWAYQCKPDRTELWLWYGAILDWRQTLKNQRQGIAADPREKAELQALVAQHGPAYYTDFVRKGLAEAAKPNAPSFKMPKDPWRTNWTDTSVETMFDKVGLKGLYEQTYRRTSEWVHWGPRAILRAMEPVEWGIAGFSEEDWPDAALALSLGCLALLLSLERLDNQFSLGHSERLTELAKKVHAIKVNAATAASPEVHNRL